MVSIGRTTTKKVAIHRTLRLLRQIHLVFQILGLVLFNEKLVVQIVALLVILIPVRVRYE